MDSIKERLKQNTNEAVEAGAFGVPTMLVSSNDDDKPQFFFGSDRFEQMAFLTGKKWHGYNPTL